MLGGLALLLILIAPVCETVVVELASNRLIATKFEKLFPIVSSNQIDHNHIGLYKATFQWGVGPPGLDPAFRIKHCLKTRQNFHPEAQRSLSQNKVFPAR